MLAIFYRRCGFLLALGAGLGFATSAAPQAAPPTNPRPEPVAETRLLMQGLNLPNYRGLHTLLRKAPADADAWTFARGQALLIAECANLLMLRPPRNEGREMWMERAAELRTTATRLARSAARRDVESARSQLSELGNVCNHCHRTFRVSVQLTPFEDRSTEPKTPRSRSPIP